MPEAELLKAAHSAAPIRFVAGRDAREIRGHVRRPKRKRTGSMSPTGHAKSGSSRPQGMDPEMDLSEMDSARLRTLRSILRQPVRSRDTRRDARTTSLVAVIASVNKRVRSAKSVAWPAATAAN